MDLIAQRGLPVRAQSATARSARSSPSPRRKTRRRQESEQPASQFEVRNDPCGDSRPRLSGRAKLDGAFWACAAERRPSIEFCCRYALHAQPAFGQAMTKGIMSPPANVRPPYLQNVGIEQHLDAQVPPDLDLHRRHRPRRQTRRLLRQQAADPEPRLLQLHHALRRSPRRTQRRHEDDQVRRRQRIRRHHRQLQSAGDAGHRRRQKAGIPQALRPRRRCRPAGISSPDRPIRSTRSPRPSASSISTIPRATSTHTPPPSWC